MLGSLPRFAGASCLAAILIGAVGLAADPDKEVTHRFKITIASNGDMEIQGKKQKLAAETELHYNWTRSGSERVLRFESVHIKGNMDGKQLMDAFMSRAKFMNTEEGRTNVVLIEKAPQELREMLQDSFGVPLCKLQVDENGKEVKRTVLAGPGAKALIDNGMIVNALLFHTPVPRDQDEWQADSEVSMGNGGYAKGKLTYKRATGDKGGQAFNVSGTLTNERFRQPGTPLSIKKANYVVRGKQTYDTAQQEWVSGRFAIDFSFQMTVDVKVVGSATGNIIVNFEKLPGNR